MNIAVAGMVAVFVALMIASEVAVAAGEGVDVASPGEPGASGAAAVAVEVDAPARPGVAVAEFDSGVDDAVAAEPDEAVGVETTGMVEVVSGTWT